MQFDDMELLNDFVVESNEHLAEIENQFLEIEAGGANINVDLVNQVFRAIHSIKGAAGFLGLSAVGALSHSLESVLNLVRGRELVPTPAIVDVMLRSADQLSTMMKDIGNSNDTDVTKLASLLDQIAAQLGMPDLADEEDQVTSDIAGQIAELAPLLDKSHTKNHIAAGPLSNAEPVEDEMDRQIRLAFQARQQSSNAAAVHGTESHQPAGPATAVSAPTVSPKPLFATNPVANPIANPVAQHSQSLAPSSKAASAVPPTKALPINAGSSRAENSGDGKTDPKNATDSSIRVSVNVLDRLMNLAGELVLARNQLLQTVNSKSHDLVSAGSSSGLEVVTAGIDQVTSELQEAIMQTRMQPIGTVFNRFPRVVRDLSSKLDKQIELLMEGNEVEVDKTIVEAIGDPLTHLVRNSVDHGIETPNKRVAKGKKPCGRISLRAYHQAGKVRIDIEDDGGGIDPNVIKNKAFEKGVINEDQLQRMNDRDAVRLIFHPGFSTAAAVTDISGRGVGMDVVKTNIERLGGTVDVDSIVGLGTTIRVTLPLTLAIVPSLIIQSKGDRYAIPQSSIVELVRVRPSEAKAKLGRVKNAEVLRLRGNLLPLVRLSDALQLRQSNTPEQANPSDTHKTPSAGFEKVQSPAVSKTPPKPKAINVVVVEATQFRYGLIVDGLHESEEIVVKPLGHHLREIESLAGATILGDGHIALILDVAGIASHQNLTSISEETARANAAAASATALADELQSALIFSNHPSEFFALPMSVISRIERTTMAEIDEVGPDLLMRYRGGNLPLLVLDRLIQCKKPQPQQSFYVVVFEVHGVEVGLIAYQLSDIRNIHCHVETATSEGVGVMGTFVLDNRTTRFLNLFELAEKAHPKWFVENRQQREYNPSDYTLLLVEDSSFFRRQLKKFITSEGFQVIEAEDGALGWQKLVEANGKVDLLVSDIEMPNMNGFELCTKIRQSTQFADLPAIALTSLSDPADVARGQAVGYNDYQIKMDKESLIRSISHLISTTRK